MPAVVDSRRRRLAAVVLLLGAGLGVRCAILARQSLWADETFSLAIATGHSVEHPPAEARPELGDWTEPAAPVAAAELARFVEHERPPAPLARVVRAVRLSDTSPPLYYLLLHVWTLAFGTSAAALRAFSVAAWLAASPLLAALARRLGGRRAVVPAVAFYAFAPAAVHYATEGRMYALLWPIACGQALASLALRRRRGGRPAAWTLWVALGAAGLLTHYFYLFPAAAFALWLAFQPRRVPRTRLVAALALVVVAVTPWYAGLARDLGRWRVTAGWLEGSPAPEVLARTPLELLAGDFVAVPPSGRTAPEGVAMRVALAAAGAAAAIALAGRKRWLPVAWLAAACLGPALFDLALATHVATLPRFGLAGLPAAYLLAAAGLARLGPRAAGLATAAAVALCAPTLLDQLRTDHRGGEPFGRLAAEIARRAGPGDLVVVQSVPAAAADLARALPPATNVLPWTVRLRDPSDVEAFERAASGRRVLFAWIHGGYDRGAALDRLEASGRRRVEWRPEVGRATLLDFGPDGAPTSR